MKQNKYTQNEFKYISMYHSYFHIRSPLGNISVIFISIDNHIMQTDNHTIFNGKYFIDNGK